MILGDPDDTFLRKVEKDILIPKILRERSRKEKCFEEYTGMTNVILYFPQNKFNLFPI